MSAKQQGQEQHSGTNNTTFSAATPTYRFSPSRPPYFSVTLLFLLFLFHHQKHEHEQIALVQGATPPFRLSHFLSSAENGVAYLTITRTTTVSSQPKDKDNTNHSRVSRGNATMKNQCICQGAQTPAREGEGVAGLPNLQEEQTLQSPSTILLTPSSVSLPDANTPSQKSQPTCCPKCCPTCADPSNPDHYRHIPTLNPALFKFLNYDVTRISQAWNNETEQEKRNYEIQALREKEAMDLGIPEFRYTKSSSAFGTTNGSSGGGGNDEDEGLSQGLEAVSLADGTLKKGRPKDDASQLAG
ncbi:hypothetical protein F5H01DRAFT_69956 [Linnemannia elongata]|nr:hypothetical protein F5H01DRAFT_69956 [Linnemannia elongata]